MQTVHNRIYTDLIKRLFTEHFDAIAAGGMILDEGENAPPGAYEPWMRIETGCWHDVVEGRRVATMRFRAGPENGVFQEVVVSGHEDLRDVVNVNLTIPGDEYRLCEIMMHFTHLIVAQEASIAGLPGCCCPDQGDEAHVHSEFIVPDVAEVGPEGHVGLRDIIPPQLDSIHQQLSSSPVEPTNTTATIRPILSVVKNETREPKS